MERANATACASRQQANGTFVTCQFPDLEQHLSARLFDCVTLPVPMNDSRHRSFELIAADDLARLAQIAVADFSDLFRRSDYSRPYADRLRVICLCQGAARHYVHGDRGVKDFDVWAFFDALPSHPFPWRRRSRRDFGPSRFGHNPDDRPNFTGRRVDVIGRSISMDRNKTPIAAVQGYLREARTTSARLLSQRPVVVVWPAADQGRVIWPP